MFEYKPKPLTTTVTYLEMKNPLLKNYQRPANINAALMRTQDISLHFYRYLQYQVGKKWHWVYCLRLSDDDLSKRVHTETTDIDVLYIDGSPAGFYELDRAKENTVDLSYFGMMEHAIGRGLGKWFLAQAISSAWESEPGRVTVNTCTLDHPAALGLYQKLGFTPIAQSETKVSPLSNSEKLNLLK